MEVIVIHREMLTEANNAHLSLLTFVVRIHNVSTSKTSISGIKDVSRKINLSFSSMSSPFATRPENSLIRGVHNRKWHINELLIIKKLFPANQQTNKLKTVTIGSLFQQCQLAGVRYPFCSEA